MNPRELYRAGRLADAIQSLNAIVRDNPTDTQSRTFLFELLCFAGEYSRADKQLEVLSGAGPDAEMGILLYRGALYAERQRQSLFLPGEETFLGQKGNDALPGEMNGQAFQAVCDADERFGALELFAAGSYMLLPFEHIESIEIEPPAKLRDLIWTPAIVRTTPSFRGAELGSVLLPVLNPGTWRHPDESVRLGRLTVWEQLEGDAAIYPYGQKMLLVDDEEIPLLEIRSLDFHSSTVSE